MRFTLTELIWSRSGQWGILGMGACCPNVVVRDAGVGFVQLRCKMS